MSATHSESQQQRVASPCGHPQRASGGEEFLSAEPAGAAGILGDTLPVTPSFNPMATMRMPIAADDHTNAEEREDGEVEKERPEGPSPSGVREEEEGDFWEEEGLAEPPSQLPFRKVATVLSDIQEARSSMETTLAEPNSGSSGLNCTRRSDASARAPSLNATASPGRDQGGWDRDDGSCASSETDRQLTVQVQGHVSQEPAARLLPFQPLVDPRHMVLDFLGEVTEDILVQGVHSDR